MRARASTPALIGVASRVHAVCEHARTAPSPCEMCAGARALTCWSVSLSRARADMPTRLPHGCSKHAEGSAKSFEACTKKAAATMAAAAKARSAAYMSQLELFNEEEDAADKHRMVGGDGRASLTQASDPCARPRAGLQRQSS
eukprot:4838900-Pleurochrysis_carterae.AAC.2